MPFSSTKRCTYEQWTEIFENVHSLAITESRLGYDCQRSNIRPGAFIKDILTMLNQADIVLADLTDMNPNVFYELGVRHTLKNRTILVSQSLDDVPSDLRQYGVILYNTTPKGVTEYKQNINKILRDIKDNPDRSDNPVSDYLKLKSIVTDTFEAKSIEKKLVALVSECSYNLTIIDYALEVTKPEGKNSNPNAQFHTGALEILISTYYIYPDDKYIKIAQGLYDITLRGNRHLELLKDGLYRDGTIAMISEIFPKIKEPLQYFMKRTFKVLKDFRNQNFIEPGELAICIENEEHKKYLG